MLNKYFKSGGVGRRIATSAVVLGFIFASNSSFSASGINPDADEILKSMSSYLSGLSEFSVKIEIANEIITTQGEKLQLNDSTVMMLQRPGKMRVNRQGEVDLSLTFDGQVLTLYSEEKNAYLQNKSVKSIDEVIDTVRTDIGLDMAGADLIYSDPYPGLVSGVISSSYLGTAYIDGIECHHLAFREDKIDWQIWVKADKEPLPMKYIITTRMMMGAPQYSVRYHDWNTKPDIEVQLFKFSAPAGAKKLTSLPVDEMGQPILGGGE